MERAADSQGDGFLRAARLAEVHRARHRHPLAAYDYLLAGVDVGHPDARFARHFLERHLVESDNRRHRAGVFVACFLHEPAALLHQQRGLVDGQRAADCEGGVLAEAMPRHDDGLRHVVRAQLVLHRLDAGEAYGEYAGLGVDGLAQVVFGPLEHEGSERASERLVYLVENLPRRRRFLVQRLAHAHRLSALPRKQVGDFRSAGFGLESERHKAILHRDEWDDE